LKGSDDKINSNRLRPDNSNNNTKVPLPRNADKDQLGQKNAVVHEKRIIYFSKPLTNIGDEDQEDSNRTEEKLGNRQSDKSRQGQQQSSFDQEKIRARNNLLRQFFPDILKAIGNKAIKDNPPTLQELESYLQEYFNELQKRKIADENAKVQDYLSRSNKHTLSSQEYDNKKPDRAHYLNGQDESSGSVTTISQKNYRLNFNWR
jgi:hypothetical protein